MPPRIHLCKPWAPKKVLDQRNKKMALHSEVTGVRASIGKDPGGYGTKAIQGSRNKKAGEQLLLGCALFQAK